MLTETAECRCDTTLEWDEWDECDTPRKVSVLWTNSTEDYFGPKPGETSSNHFEHFEADVRRLGASMERYSERHGPAFRRRLAQIVQESEIPNRLIACVVDHCCDRPSQTKIEDCADVLGMTAQRLVSFVENRDLEYCNHLSFEDRVWLYATAMSWADDSPTRQRRVNILTRWLKEDDSAVRESAANALGALGATEAAAALRSALAAEEDSATHEAIADALEDVGSAP